MLKILVPLDGSILAMKALRYAIGFTAAGMPIMICLINVQQVYLPTEKSGHLSQSVLEPEQRGEAKEILREATDLLKVTEIPYKSHMEIGNIAKTISNYASLHGCDLIVMGTRGRSAIGNIVLGSTANQVIHFSQVPVTLVK